MLIPPRKTAPRCSAAPERIFPVCPGWMPTPVACLLNSPETTLSFGRKDASGSRLRLNCMFAPAPDALQCGGLMPLPMKRAAKRLGGADAGVPAGDGVQNGIDSSHGRAIVTPALRRKVRRVDLREINC